MVFYVDSQKSSSAEEIAFLLNKCILQYPAKFITPTDKSIEYNRARQAA